MTMRVNGQVEAFVRPTWETGRVVSTHVTTPDGIWVQLDDRGEPVSWFGCGNDPGDFSPVRPDPFVRISSYSGGTMATTMYLDPCDGVFSDFAFQSAGLLGVMMITSSVTIATGGLAGVAGAWISSAGA
jgi:hypothetical protein